MNSVFGFSINGLHLLFPAYSTFAGLGAMLFMFCFYVQTLKLGIAYWQFLTCCLIMGIGMVLGSKILFIVVSLPEVFCNFSWSFLWDTIVTSGFVFYGGLFGAIAGVLAASKLLNIKFSTLLNSVVLGFPLFHSCGRIGCFFTGCCYGVEWKYGCSIEAEPEVIRFPVQLIESCCLIVIFIILLVLKIKGSAELTKYYLVMYAVCRFVLEFFRGDTVRGIWFGLSTSQWISLWILVWYVLCVFNKKASADVSRVISNV